MLDDKNIDPNAGGTGDKGVEGAGGKEPSLLDGGADADAKAKADADIKAKADADIKAKADKEAYEKLSPEEKVIHDKKVADDKKANSVPEKYEDFKLPEGMTLDKAVSEKFTVLAKELNLTQASAQKLVDLQASLVQEQTKASVADYNKLVNGWKEEALKVLGTDPKEKLAVASKAIKQFGTPELRQLLNETGLGNHKEVIAFFMKVGEAISEDSFADGKFVGDKGKKSDGDLFYPDMKK